MSRLGVIGLVAAGMLAAGAARADASIIITFNGSAPSAGGFTYNYTVDLTSGESLNTANGAQFFTIYDFYGFTGVQSFTVTSPLVALAGGSFSFSNPNVGLTPNAPCCPVGPSDDADIGNLAYTYTGGAVAGPTTLGTLAVESTASFSVSDNYAAQVTANNALTANISTTQVPAVPEPGSMFLLGTGLLGLASLARRRLKNTVN